MNFKVWKPDGGALIKAFVDGVEFEEQAQEQIHAIAKMPFIYPHIAVMPDVHMGIGATVGSVIPTKGAIIPAAVGVDIGCGMTAVKLPIKASDLPDSLWQLRSDIERAVPHGRTNDGRPGDRGAWTNPPDRHSDAWMRLVSDYETVIEAHPKAASRQSPVHHLGTLGTGNHFIEICLDEAQNVWVVLHSGSRGVGNRFGTYFIELARRDMEKWFINLPDKDLAYFPEGTDHFADYWGAVEWAQRYAATNREIMMLQILDVLRDYDLPIPIARNELDLATNFDVAISCHHNYVAIENHGGKNVYITRKGAVCAREGTMGIIPGSMGAKSYIVRGKGNPDGLHSCSHGAGRRMSRTEARRWFSVADHERATAGVECRKDAEVIDETPMAYKDIDAVMEAQKDLVEIVATLKQVLCVKG